MNSRDRQLVVLPGGRAAAVRRGLRQPSRTPALSAMATEATALLGVARLQSDQTRWLRGELVDVMLSPVGDVFGCQGIVVTIISKKGPASDLTALIVEATDASGGTHRRPLDSRGHVLLEISSGPYRLSVSPESRVGHPTGEPAEPRSSGRSTALRSDPRRPSWHHVATAAAAVALFASALVAVRTPPAVATTVLSPVSCEKTTGTSRDDRVVVAAVWGGTERKRFLEVLKRFEKRTGFEASFATDSPRADRNLANTLNTYIAQGCPPDVVLAPQPGLVRELADEGKLLPLDGVAGRLLDENYTPKWVEQTRGSDVGRYAVPFKGAHKSLIWYNARAFELADITTPPRTFDELKQAAAKLEGVGIAPFAVSGKDGWTLTDWFENLYLKMWGPDAYDALANHRIRWTDDKVTNTLAHLGELFATPGWVAGGTRGALNTSYEESVALVFGEKGLPRAAMVMEGDFVANEIAKTPAKIGVDANFFEFPAFQSGADGGHAAGEGAATALLPARKVVGGDFAAVMRGRATPAAIALVRFLATPEGAEVWLQEVGFLSPNQKVKKSSLSQTLMPRSDATKVVFDLSDTQHPSFGSDPNHGMWAILQEFLRRPDTVEDVTRRLENERVRLTEGPP